MTTQADIYNLALQSFGSRTTVTAAQIAANSNNEVKQGNLTYVNTRDSLLRMAPWNCGQKTANLVYITSVPGTPENTSAQTNLWTPGQPRPPWSYEYQYPVDCLRPCWMIPSTQIGFASGVPITTAVTGGASTLWNGAPISYKVAIDQFFTVGAGAVLAPGVGYLVNDVVSLLIPTGPGVVPVGAPAQFVVTSVNGAGGVTGVALVNQILGSAGASGSYFNQTSISSTTTGGTGAGLTISPSDIIQGDQRIILTNQEFATLVYVRQVTDPNVWDPLFQDAMSNALGADICMGLTGDKTLANMCIARANRSIEEARKADGNEGLTINDVTPDWIRARGVWWMDNMQSGPYSGFDWGGVLPSY